MAQATCELLWRQHLLTSLHIRVHTCAKLFCDNKFAMHIATNPVFHERAKHVEIDCHTVKDEVKNGFIKLMHVASANQHDDILMKPLHPRPFQSILNCMFILTLFVPNPSSISSS